MSDQLRADPAVVVGSYHEQPVPIFQQFAGGYPIANGRLSGVPHERTLASLLP